MAEQGTISFRFVGDTRQLQKAVNTAKHAVSNMAKSVKENVTEIGIAFAGMALAVRKVTMVYADFERVMVRVGAISNATETEVRQLEDVAVDLAKTTKFSASEVASAYQFMAMAGQDVATIQDAIGPTLQLAAAGALDLGQAADITTGIMAAFGKESSELARVNDVLAKAITSSKTDVSGLGQSFMKVGPVAKFAGLQFDELTAALSLVAQGNLRGAEAGTSFKTAIARMLNPVGKTKDMLDDLGISFKTTDGKLKSFVEILKELERGITDPQQLIEIFGTRGILGMSILVENGSEALKDMTANLRDSGGLAEKIAKKEMATLSGSLNSMRAAVEGLVIQLGRGMAPAIKLLADTVNVVASALASLPDIVHRIGGVALVTATSVTGLAFAWGLLSKGFAIAAPIISMAAKNLKLLALRMVPLIAPALVITGIMAGLVVILGVLRQVWDFYAADAKAALKKVADAWKDLDLSGIVREMFKSAIMLWISGTNTIKAITKHFMKAIQKAFVAFKSGGLKEAWESLDPEAGFSAAMDEASKKTAEAASTIDDKLNKALEGTKDTISDLGESIVEQAKKAKEGIVDPIKNAFNDGVRTIVDGMKLLTGLGAEAEKISKKVSAPKFKRPGRVAGPAGPDFAAQEALRIKKLSSSFQGMIQIGIEQSGLAIEGGFEQAASGLAKAAEMSGAAMVNTARTIAGSLAGAAQSVAPKLAGAVNAFAQGFTSGGGPIGGLIALAAQLLSQTQGFKRILEFGEKGVEDVLTVLDDFMEPLSEIVAAIHPISQILTAQLRPAFMVLGSVLGVVAKILNAIVSAIVKVWNKLVNSVAKLFGKIPGIGDSLKKSIRKLRVNVEGSAGLLPDDLDKLRDSVNGTTSAMQSLTNVPSGVKVALERFRSIDPNLVSRATPNMSDSTVGQRLGIGENESIVEAATQAIVDSGVLLEGTPTRTFIIENQNVISNNADEFVAAVEGANESSTGSGGGTRAGADPVAVPTSAQDIFNTTGVVP